jgi:hypothetical protein
MRGKTDCNFSGMVALALVSDWKQRPGSRKRLELEGDFTM